EGGNPPVAPPKENTSQKSSRGSGGATLATYDVTALATSSLLGLVQSLKDHITKPTAMAQGRVAHLIEWKGWNAPPVGWGQPPTEEVLYEELTDELKEARFAAGVAEQFAITEATLSGWSSLNEEELNDRGGSQDVIQLQDLEGIYLQDGLLLCPPAPAGSLQAFVLSNPESPIPSRAVRANEWSRAKGGLGRAEGKLVGPPNARRWQQSATSLRYVDSSSPSEDEVFYD
ncbi:PREDICTED: protein FAM131C, partial [Thamnophis sirtalis]|uniref:Protein FAM131C n=1 Tax=Thamnophis sirtalis TaxID=35019 RepID=A0A6I9XKM6_9SAUR